MGEDSCKEKRVNFAAERVNKVSKKEKIHREQGEKRANIKQKRWRASRFLKGGGKKENQSKQ